MIKEVKYQVEAVKKLVAKAIDLLDRSDNRKKLVFKAPTGSGKTVMASQLLDELTSQLEETGQEIAIIWIAPNKLHQQSYFRMKNYFSETRALSPVMYDELDHSIDGYIKPGEIFFVNWESINKESNVMVRDTETSSSLYDLTRRTQETHNLPIIVVVDEEHMFGGRYATQSEKVLATINPKLEIRISATPISSNVAHEVVTIDREEVIKAEMIKNGITINPKIKDGDSGLSENDFLLDKALARRNEIKKAYEELGVRINPLLLIQLPNDDSNKIFSSSQAGFMKHLRRQGLSPHYVAVREQKKDKPHFHVALTLDHSKTKSPYKHLKKMESIVSRKVSSITGQDKHSGLVEFCDRDQEGNSQPNTHIISRNNPESYNEAFERASYLAKVNTKPEKRIRELFVSQLNKRKKE